MPAGGPKADFTEDDITRRILVVDDDPVFQTLWRAILERAGFEALVAGTGRGGLDAAERERPDAVLLDSQLPDMPGLEVLARLAGDASLSAIPVLMLSAEDSPQTRERALALGAVRYLTKPIPAEQLTRALEDAFENS